MENKNQIEKALEDLLNMKKEDSVQGILEEYLCSIASTGVTGFPWSKLKPLLSCKMEEMMNAFQEKQPCKLTGARPNVECVTFEDMKICLHSYLDIFKGIPFTIQRLCELLSSKNVFKQYKNSEKYLRALEKNLMVVTTVDPSGRRVVIEPKVTNGLIFQKSPSKTDLSAPITNSTPKTETGKDSPRNNASWFSCLSDVVESPNSYPTWNHSAKSETSQFKRMGNGDLKDPDSNVIFSSKFKSLSTDDDFEISQPASKAIKLDEEAMKEEGMKKNPDRPQSSPLLCELLDSSSATLTQPSTNRPPPTVASVPSNETKSPASEKKNITTERKTSILATSAHQGEGVPTNVVHPLQQSESVDQEEEKLDVEMKDDNSKICQDFKKEVNKQFEAAGLEVPVNVVAPVKEVVENVSSECHSTKVNDNVDKDTFVGDYVLKNTVQEDVTVQEKVLMKEETSRQECAALQEGTSGDKENSGKEENSEKEVNALKDDNIDADDNINKESDLKLVPQALETSKLKEPLLTKDQINNI